MCYGSDWVLLVWMLKSLLMWQKEMPALVIHIQKHIKPSAVALIRYHFPGARLIMPDESELVVSRYLIEKKLPRTLYWWQRSGVMNKLVAVQVFCRAENVLWLDSDILFYRQPVECFSEIDTLVERVVFQRDCSSNYTIPVQESSSLVGVRLLPCVNTGIVLRSRDFLSLEDVERYLQYPEIACSSGHIEQTLQALCISASGAYSYLPETYAIEMNRSMDPANLVCRHYAGPSKKLMSNEGMSWLVEHGIMGA